METEPIAALTRIARDISLPMEALADFCRRNRVQRMALFGSVLRDDFRPDSDVDVLVEFEPGHHLGFAFFGLQDELTEMLGRQVDLNTKEWLSRYFGDEVVRTAVVIYSREDETAASAP